MVGCFGMLEEAVFQYAEVWRGEYGVEAQKRNLAYRHMGRFRVRIFLKSHGVYPFPEPTACMRIKIPRQHFRQAGEFFQL